MKRESLAPGRRKDTHFWPNGILDADDGDASEIVDELLLVVPVLRLLAQILVGDADRSQAIIGHFLDDVVRQASLFLLVRLFQLMIFAHDGFASRRRRRSDVVRSRRMRAMLTWIEPFLKHLWCTRESRRRAE